MTDRETLVAAFEPTLRRIVDADVDGGRAFQLWLQPERGTGERGWSIHHVAGLLADVALAAVGGPADGERRLRTEHGVLIARQWCTDHGCHQDDPDHDYAYPTCERALRVSTSDEDAAVLRKLDALPVGGPEGTAPAGDEVLDPDGQPYDEEEVTSWSERADEFAVNARHARERFERTKDMSMTEAVSETGRSAISWLSLSEGYMSAEARVRHVIPRLAVPSRSGRPDPGEDEGLTAEQGVAKLYGFLELRALARAWASEEAPEAGDIRVCGHQLDHALDRILASPSSATTEGADTGALAEGPRVDTTERLNDTTATRECTPGVPSDGPYPATVGDVASEVVEWISERDRRGETNGLTGRVLSFLSAAGADTVPTYDRRETWGYPESVLDPVARALSTAAGEPDEHRRWHYMASRVVPALPALRAISFPGSGTAPASERT